MKLSKIEIELLAEDVRNNINQTLDIAKFSIAASCALVGLGLGNIEKEAMMASLICLLPFPILIAAVEMIFNRRRNIMKKATFLRLHGKEHYQWELSLYKLRKYKKNRNRKKEAGESFTRTVLNLFLAIYIMSAAAAIVMFFYGYSHVATSDKICKMSLVGLLIIVAVTVAGLRFRSAYKNVEQVLMGGDAEDDAAAAWKISENEPLRDPTRTSRSHRLLVL